MTPSDLPGCFHPLVARWFRGELGEPTPIQLRAWGEIAQGNHVLVTAPTGTGKTLAAFLWALDRLITGAWCGGRVQVLYVSPLKALNNDIQRNLLAPLAGLSALFEQEGEPASPVRVLTRSGDTPSSQRQRMMRHPPEILITTPESLNLLLTSAGGRSLLHGVSCVVLDEIHAVAGSKRGTHLMTAVERLTLLSGEFQRIALSATVRPLKRVASLVGGFRPAEAGAPPRPRTVVQVQSGTSKTYDLEVDCPLEPVPAAEPVAGRWDPLVAACRARIRRNRSTLVFTNSRRMAERLTRLLNDGERAVLACPHHGSLSRELRAVVEERLKAGRLSAIVATSSLELGIDIGALEEVILVQTPPTVASAVQRVGRAGHGVGEVSRGRIYPLSGRDLLEAAVVARGILEQDVEEVEPVSGALDVLAQVILSMTAAECWRVEELLEFLRCTWPYRNLSRNQLDGVLEMLAGRFADSRVRELEPRVSLDRLDGTVRARPGAARLVYLSGGTIPDRGYYTLRHVESQARIGELDEEFIWERSAGDSFTLGAQSWRIQSVTHDDVLVAPAERSAAMAPFWRAEERSRSYLLSRRIGELLQRAEGLLQTAQGGPALRRILEMEHRLSRDAAARLTDLLQRQRAATSSGLPHRQQLLLEQVTTREASSGGSTSILHTFWGGRVNRPLAMALEAAWQDRQRSALSVECDNDCLLLELPRGASALDLLESVRSDNVEALLRRRLETTGFFGARFREACGRALLLPRSDPRRRMPLWRNRQRARQLLRAVQRYDDFPIRVEAWRTCLQDELDLTSLQGLLDELARGEIQVAAARTSSPSPFAANLIWKQTNRLMYEDDTPEGEGGTALRGDLLREVVFTSGLRPPLPQDLLDLFQSKLHRTYPGYAPTTAVELLDWVRERVVLPEREWDALLAAVERDLASGGPEAGRLDDLLRALRDKLARTPGPPEGTASGPGAVCAREMLPRIQAVLGPGPAADPEQRADVISEWLRYYGPLSPAHVMATFHLEPEENRAVLEDLVASERVVVDRLGEAAEEEEVCDAENLERLLRIHRARSRASLEALPLDRLPLFLATHQGLTQRAGSLEALQDRLEQLLGFPAPAGLWETELLPARLDPYYPGWLDRLLAETDLQWMGCGNERLAFTFATEPATRPSAGGGPDPLALFPRRQGRHDFEELRLHSRLAPVELTRRLWDLVWTGQVSATGFAAVRAGVTSRFAPLPPVTQRGRTRRWRPTRPVPGDWYCLEPSGEAAVSDALEEEELSRERARILLARYGVLFRELCAREAEPFTWARLSRSLRLMELSGEVIAGHFFQGVSGLQFATPAAHRRLAGGLEEDPIYWMNAQDPASPCGLGLEGFSMSPPPRLPGTHLVYHGARLVVVSRRQARELEIAVPPDHPHLEDYLSFLEVLVAREVQPLARVEIETINGRPAAHCPHGDRIVERLGATRDPGGLRLRRNW